MANIKMTPEDLISGAKIISTKGQEIQTDLDTIEKKIDEVTAAWEGAAQSSFVAEFESMRKSLKDFPTVIQGISNQINGAGTNLQKADQEIAAQFNK